MRPRYWRRRDALVGALLAGFDDHAVAPRRLALVLGYARLPEAGLRAAARALLAAMDDAARSCDNRYDVI